MSLFRTNTSPAPQAPELHTPSVKPPSPASVSNTTPMPGSAPTDTAVRPAAIARPAFSNSAAVAPTKPVDPDQNEGARRLVVGKGIRLTGEVASCDTLVVEGTIEAKLTGARLVEVSETGTFKGSAEIQDATIAGLFEGDLTVTGVLKVMSTGMIRGNLRCGTLEVQKGGRISGSMTTIVVAASPMGLARVV